MAEEKKSKMEVKAEEKKMEKKEEAKAEEKKVEVKTESAAAEKKTDAKAEKRIEKKGEAVVNANDLHLSKKHAMYICRFIKGKPIDQAILELGQVIKLKRVIPFVGEIPHRSAPGIMSGRYPVNASKIFITLLKGLKGNAIVNGLDLDKTRIYFGMPNWAPRPARRGGMRGKRTHVTLKAKEVGSSPRVSDSGRGSSKNESNSAQPKEAKK